MLRNAALLFSYAVFVTAANVLLKLSAGSAGAAGFWLYQAAGNLIGFFGILIYTAVLRTAPLHVAFPVSRGVGVLGIQLVASLLVFHEVFRTAEAVGIALVTAGIILVGLSARPRGAVR